MTLNRRHLLGTFGVGAASAATPLHAAPLPAMLGRDVTVYGVRPNSSDDQTGRLQRAINDTANANVPLVFPPGVYRSGPLQIPDRAQLTGIRAASTLMFSGGGPSLLASRGASHVLLSNLKLDGGGIALPARRGLVHGLQGEDFRILDCAIVNSGGGAIWLENCSGEISGNVITHTAVTAIFSLDALGLQIARNAISGTSDNGIEILRSAFGDDGTQVIDNRIENIKAGPGGTGQYGNAINAFRAGNVIISGNRIRNCDYSGIRGNSASNIQIIGNNISDVREVAIYSEFSFEAAVIANNVVDGAGEGVSVCNFNEGGRIAVVQGNIFRNLLPKRPADGAAETDAGVGIYVEADTAVTGNVVENAPHFGIIAGWGRYLRDVAITGNVVRNSFIGIGVSVVDGAGTALVNNNVISGSSRGAIVGLDHARPITPDLTAPGAATFSQIVLGTNAISNTRHSAQ